MAARPEGPCGDRIHHRSKTMSAVCFRQGPSRCSHLLNNIRLSIAAHESMNRSTTIKLPALNIPSPPPRGFGARGRSGSIVKVEQVGDRFTEEDLDRSAYVNINADWVNAKGVYRSILISLLNFLPLCFSRCMANPRCAHHLRQDYYRHCTRDDTANELDIGQSLLSGSRFFSPHALFFIHFSHRAPT